MRRPTCRQPFTTPKGDHAAAGEAATGDGSHEAAPAATEAAPAAAPAAEAPAATTEAHGEAVAMPATAGETVLTFLGYHLDKAAR